MGYLSQLASYPALQTPTFQQDGTTEFRSRLQIFVFVPSVCGIILMACLFIIPLFQDFTMDTRITENSLINLGFPVFQNQTHHNYTDERYSIYEKFYSALYQTRGLESRMQLDFDELFQQFNITIRDIRNKPLEYTPEIKFIWNSFYDNETFVISGLEDIMTWDGNLTLSNLREKFSEKYKWFNGKYFNIPEAAYL